MYNYIMKPIVIDNILSEFDIKRIHEIINNEYASRPIIDEGFPKNTKHDDNAIIYFGHFGRVDIRHLKIPQDIIDKVTKIVMDTMDNSFTDVVFSFIIYAEYSLKSGGNPKLEPHFDISEGSTIILDYQLESNVSWDLIVESESFTLKDNDGILFDPLSNIHYRPVQSFKDDEFVRMLFFRFGSSKPVAERKSEDIDRLNITQLQYDLTISSN